WSTRAVCFRSPTMARYIAGQWYAKFQLFAQQFQIIIRFPKFRPVILIKGLVYIIFGINERKQIIAIIFPVTFKDTFSVVVQRYSDKLIRFCTVISQCLTIF